MRKHAAELVALAPDVLVAGVGPTTATLQQPTRTVPIVFAAARSGRHRPRQEPGAAGRQRQRFYAVRIQPERKMAGTAQGDRTAKSRARLSFAILAVPLGLDRSAVIQAVASPIGVELSPVDLRDTGEIERDVAEFADGPNGGLIVAAGAVATIRRDLVVALAARHKLPAVYPYRFFVEAGGLDRMVRI